MKKKGGGFWGAPPAPAGRIEGHPPRAVARLARP